MHGGLPLEKFKDGAFVGYHGSWNRDTPTGYKVVYIPFEETIEEADNNRVRRMVPTLRDREGAYKQQVQDFLWNGRNNKAKWRNGFRPVDVKFDQLGRLLVSSDGSRRGRGYSGSMVVMIVNRGS